MVISRLSNKFESLSIKKNNLGNYVLYGLMWWEFIQDDRPIRSLVSVKSDNLKWNVNIDMSEDYEHVRARGSGGSILASFITGITRKALYSFSFENIHSNDVLLTLTILNDGRDGFMRYNIYEGLESYTVKINVAGVKKDEVRVVLEDGVVKIRTNPKKQEVEDIDVKVEMFEPIKSDVEIFLPNIESVSAKLEDGILTLVAPKESKGVKIDIE